MAGKIVKYRWQPTTVSGTLSEDTSNWSGLTNSSLILNHIFLKPTGSALFNFKITSPNSNVIFERKNIENELNEMPLIGMRGLYTLEVYNCDPNRTFEGEFTFEEKKG